MHPPLCWGRPGTHLLVGEGCHMAHDDTLFQLGMDLEIGSSTAQKEEHGSRADVALYDDRKDYFIERDGVRFAGTHLLVDLFGARRLDDLAHIEKTLRRCIDVAGATLLHIHLHHFTPNGGVSGVAVLSESHISIHSWPEANYAALDIFMCGDARPELAVPVLREAFDADQVVVKEHLRGMEMSTLSWAASAANDKPALRPLAEAAVA
jgi:S-adenosylmethionine decarboxylase